MKCILCDKEILNKGISSHLRRAHNMSSKEYYDTYVKTETDGKCKICGKATKFNTILTGYRVYCSSRCANLDSEIRTKIENTSIKKYGVKCNLNLEETKKKASQNSQTKEAKDKRAQTNLQKYGATNPYGSKIIIDKIRQNNLQKYGVEYSWQRDDVKTKIRQTNLKRYDSISHTKSKKFKIVNYLDRQDKLNRFEIEHNCLRRRKVIDLYGTGWQYDCANLHIQPLKYIGVNFIKNEDVAKIAEYAKINHYQTSHTEIDLQNYIKSIYFGQIITNTRTIVHHIELDIYLPDLQIAIEYNGKYWHSYPRKDKDYHLGKSLACREKGVRLIHIYEFEDIEEQKQLLKDLINGQDNYPKNDFNKNNLIDLIPQSEIIFDDGHYTIYGAGKLFH